MRDYMVRFVQVHETFRIPELLALAKLADVELEIREYTEDSPFCIIRLASDTAASAIISRSIISHDIYELWASGDSYPALHAAIQSNAVIDVEQYRKSSFRFKIDSFQGKRKVIEQGALIDSFAYLPLEGPIQMEGAQLQMCVLEEFDKLASEPKRLHLGRWIARSNRDAIVAYTLKKRIYISRTSMDSELALVTANLTLAAPGKILYDPFVGTGSFSIAAAHFGARALGSDIDGRSVRGTPEKNIKSNFEQYDCVDRLLDNFIADLTHIPLRRAQIMDGIICDPPYGVREGPKVLGYREGKEAVPVFIDGVAAHMRTGYIPAKRPYGFQDMLDDILQFSFEMLVDGGRLSMWMPTADDEEAELATPSHPGLELLHVCVQHFNKWSRRLLTYQRRPQYIVMDFGQIPERKQAIRGSADAINPFRKKYFEGFRGAEMAADTATHAG